MQIVLMINNFSSDRVRKYTKKFKTNQLCICVLAYRIKENGQERTEIEEDGVLKTVLINGKVTYCTFNWVINKVSG